MHGFDDLLSHFTQGELASALDVPVNTAGGMKRRASVAPSYWPRLIEAATQRGLLVNAEMLARFASERKTRSLEDAD